MVGICSRNRPEKALADLTILEIEGIVFPIDAALPPSGVKHLRSDSL
jgi:long-subunit acyl-CoA synthetase (AMP-forming)